jgi:hypothetical protein
MLAGIFVKAFTHYSQHEIGGVPVNYAPPVGGIEVPIVIGLGALALGLVLSLVLRRTFPDYFGRGREVLAAADCDPEDLDA